MLITLATALLGIAIPQAPELGAADPIYARDGRLAVSIRGDLWIRGTNGDWTQVTSGADWDHQPAWLPDGRLVFASDRSGNFDLWVTAIPQPNTRVNAPDQLTQDPVWEGEPSASIRGDIVFVRGAGAAARLWRRDAADNESRVTTSTSPERWPAFAPNDERLAYVEAIEGANELRLRSQDGHSTRTLVSDREVERPAWSPDGRLISFSTRTATAGLWLTDPANTFVNLVSNQMVYGVWHPNGAEMTIVSSDPAGPGYNGDPDRVGDRSARASIPTAGALSTIDAPRTPYPVSRAMAFPKLDRRVVNEEAFDRTWERLRQLYYGGPHAGDRAAQWSALRTSHRPEVLGARSEAELSAALHAMLRERPPYGQSASGRAAVSSAHPVATAAGVEILEMGGNVVDAAIAVSFALGVVEPDASGIGGYGQMLIFQPGMAEPALIEFMTRVPEEASLANAALMPGGRYPSDGPMLANVPGTVAAMHLAWKKYGSRSVEWSDLVQPAIRAARGGYVVSDGLATTLATEREHFLKYPGSSELFFRNGTPLEAGDSIRNPDLAWALEQIATDGADAFYTGEVGRKMVADLRAQGNAMQMTDLSRYYAAERPPVGTSYRGYSVFASAPPSSGGSTLAAQLNLLERYAHPGNYTTDPNMLHAMIEAWKLVPSSRGRIADPGLWPVDTEPFTNKDSARVRWKCFDPEHALTIEQVQRSASCALAPTSESRLSLQHEACDATSLDRFCHLSGTTSFAVADGRGNMISVTQTLGTWGGNFYVTPGLGFLYNDKLTSYGTEPNSYGARLPFARHGSSIAPTIILKGTGDKKEAFLATGAAGNAWITSAVFSIVTGTIDGGLGPQSAIELPRFLIGRRRVENETAYIIQLEQGVPPDVLAQLNAKGHTIQFISMLGELRMGYATAVMVKDGRAIAAADPRRSGSAGAVK